ncbi:MAG: transglutaminase domain-containing protein [Desulfobacterales bacterium]|jgi:hypothetical protein|nr:transglutaminase domain-containing protein [Desulfobacteraceae bacterium]MBT4363552.1 transglutaminase domain-containing protein [Desulfobacteraceae bacterium]MBT7084791.1 transglutaminase domain-containing protein [Desulfobacterales bacterium]MBT7698342.1 transglutaminase domain-containing protein [Desulfobacterales bacterium]
MKLYKNTPFRIAGLIFCLSFIALLSVRIDLFTKFNTDTNIQTVSPENALSNKKYWMNILQNNEKIGYSYTEFLKTDTGYRLKETIFMRINTMGMIQNLSIATNALLNNDLSLSLFTFSINSGLFKFTVDGKVKSNLLTIHTRRKHFRKKFSFQLKKKPYLTSGVLPAIRNEGLGPGDTRSFFVFDPATMGQETLKVKVLKKEEIKILGEMHEATKISLNFKGAEQFAWIDVNGELLKESGLLGITLEKTNHSGALSGISKKPVEDITKMASIPSNILLNDPSSLNMLEFKITGVDKSTLNLQGLRQLLNGDHLTIRKEDIDDLPETFEITPDAIEFLKPTPFIQSDHPEIVNTVKSIINKNDSPLEKSKKLVSWIRRNIKKRPVLSVPDALSTFKNRIGDCNEHAVLLASFARAAGIPAKVESGLAYLNGRFYYHAWNLLYLGRWITADSTFSQLPADVAHIRFTSGSQETQLDLISVIDRVKIEVIKKQ